MRALRLRFHGLALDIPTLTPTLSRQREREKRPRHLQHSDEGFSCSLSLRERAGALRCGSRNACALLDSVKKGGLSPASGLQDRAPRFRFRWLALDFPTLTLTLTLSRQRERGKNPTLATE